MRISFKLLVLTLSVSMQLFAQDITSSMQFLLRKPTVETADPKLLILLHGVGSNEHDLFSFESKIPDEFYVISPRAPITLAENSFAWYHVDFSSGKPIYNSEEELRSRKILHDFIQRMKDSLSIATANVYLAGFSQGAILSYNVALTDPALVRGIAVFSGRLLEEIKPAIQADHLSDLTIFISHGKKDPMLQVQYAHDANSYLKSIGAKVSMHEYSAKHEITSTMVTDFLIWLAEM